jgi:hypothetical protein
MAKLTKCLVVAVVIAMIAIVALPIAENVTAVPTGWNEKKLSTDVAPQGVSMAVDVNGKVHIVGFDYNYGAHLVYMDDVAGSWLGPYTIDTRCAGTPPVIAVDSNGHSHIVYVQQNYSLMYVTNAGGSWVNTTIFHDPLMGHFDFSIAVDHNNKVHIAFCTLSDYVVKHVTNAGGSWVTENVTSGSHYGSSPSIAIDSNNKVHIACLYTGSIVAVAYLENTTGTWTSTIVDKVYYIEFVSMCLDHNDKAHIAYMTGYTAIHYATDASGAWLNTTASSIPVANDAYQYVPIIVVDSANNPSISYCNTTSDTGYYAEVTTKSGSAWTITRLGAGFSVAMGINSNDNLYVAYNRAGIVLDSTGTITGSSSTTASAPGPVASATATAGNNQVTIAWAAPSTGGSASTVLIYRSSTNSMPASPLTTVSASGGQYVDSTAVNNQTYYYWVISSNNDGNGQAVATGAVTPAASSSSSPSSTGNNGTVLIGLIALIIVVLVIVAFVFMRRKRKG